MLLDLAQAKFIYPRRCYIKICTIFTNVDDPCLNDRDHMNELDDIIKLCPSPPPPPPPPDVSSNPIGGQYIKLIHHCQLVPINWTVLKHDPLPLDKTN